MTTRKYSIIAIKGQVYNISFSTKYENGQNCEKRDFETAEPRGKPVTY